MAVESSLGTRDSTSLPRPCAQANSPRLCKPSRFPPPSRFLLWGMALLNGHALRLLVAFQDRLLPFNSMEPCSVAPIILSTHKNEGRSAMARSVCCMLLASALVADAPCVPSVKKAVPPPHHDGSGPFSGPALLPRQFPLHLFSGHLNRSYSCQSHLLIAPSFGVLGHALTFGAHGSTSCEPKPWC